MAKPKIVPRTIALLLVVTLFGSLVVSTLVIVAVSGSMILLGSVAAGLLLVAAVVFTRRRYQRPIVAICDGDGHGLVSAGIGGRVVTASGNTDVAGVGIWFAYRDSSGVSVTVETISDVQGGFSFEIPSGSVGKPRVGANMIGIEPVDLVSVSEVLGAAEVVLVIDDFLPSHLRYA